MMNKWSVVFSMIVNISFTTLAHAKSKLVVDFVPTKIATSFTHTCILSTTGQVKCWGNNSSGELGIATTTNHGHETGTMGPNLPIVNFGTDLYAKELCVGDQTTCVATTDGRVKCWGHNNDGQLGQGREMIAVGRLTNDMGDNLPFTNLGPDFKVESLACGRSTNCALSDTGKLKCWGLGVSGQLGPNIFPKTNIGRRTDEMGDNLPLVALPIRIEHVAVGFAHTCAASKSEIYCWGSNTAGQAGVESTAKSIYLPASPTQAMQVKLEDSGVPIVIEHISSGYSHNCALYRLADRVTEQKVKCWGENYYGSLGIGSTDRNIGHNTNSMGAKLPQTSLVLNHIMQVEVHADFSCALTKNGELKCWGANLKGELGMGDSKYRGTSASEMGTQLPFVNLGLPILGISAGSNASSSCAILANHEIKCWGAANYGTLGYEDGVNRGAMEDDMGENLPFVRYQ